MKVTIRSGIMNIKLPVITPMKKSKSGKTLLVASSGGNRRTALKLNGKRVIVNANAYIRPEKASDKSQRGVARGATAVNRRPVHHTVRSRSRKY
jgi:hypothetical protein